MGNYKGKHRTDRRRDNAIARITALFDPIDSVQLDIVLSYITIDTLEVIAVRLEEREL